MSESGLASLSIESANPTSNFTGDTRQVVVREMTTPANPTPEHPLRHTINLGLFDDEDLIKIYSTIQQYLGIF
jgi:hypothetical protein